MDKVARNGIVVLHAGDSFVAPLFLNAGDKTMPIRYDLQENDKLYVGVMEPNQPFPYAIIRKVLTKKDCNIYGDPEFKLTPEDTERLMPGLYYYEAKLVFYRNDDSDSDDEEFVQTVVPKTKLYILE